MFRSLIQGTNYANRVRQKNFLTFGGGPSTWHHAQPCRINTAPPANTVPLCGPGGNPPQRSDKCNTAPRRFNHYPNGRNQHRRGRQTRHSGSGKKRWKERQKRIGLLTQPQFGHKDFGSPNSWDLCFIKSVFSSEGEPFFFVFCLQDINLNHQSLKPNVCLSLAQLTLQPLSQTKTRVNTPWVTLHMSWFNTLHLSGLFAAFQLVIQSNQPTTKLWKTQGTCQQSNSRLCLSLRDCFDSTAGSHVIHLVL